MIYYAVKYEDGRYQKPQSYSGTKELRKASLYKTNKTAEKYAKVNGWFEIVKIEMKEVEE